MMQMERNACILEHLNLDLLNGDHDDIRQSCQTARDCIVRIYRDSTNGFSFKLREADREIALTKGAHVVRTTVEIDDSRQFTFAVQRTSDTDGYVRDHRIFNLD